MYRNTLIFLILLHSVVCSQDPTVEQLTKTTAMTSVSPESDSTHTSLSSSSTFMDLSTTNRLNGSTALSVNVSEEPQGLTVAVGSIAGVAALGGGIYAGLKYTGQLAG